MANEITQIENRFRDWLREMPKCVVNELTSDSLFKLFVDDWLENGDNFSEVALVINEVEKENNALP